MTCRRPARRPTTARRAPPWLAAALALLAAAGCSCEGPQPRPPVSPEGVPLVRVKLGQDADALVVTVEGAYHVFAGGERAGQGGRLAPARLEAAADGILLGGRALGAGPVEVRPAEGGRFCLQFPAAGGKTVDRTYRGRLRVHLMPEGRLRAVNVLDVEAYLAGVVACELFASWHLEAFKAQAVAARTYALAERGRHRARDFDVYDSVQSQAYGGVSKETERAWRAVAATQAIVGTVESADGKPRLLRMYYHSTCGGATSPAASVFGGTTPPPLAGVTCTYCRASRRYRWSGVTFRKREIGDALRASGNPALATLDRVTRVEVASRDPVGRATEVRIVTASGRSLRIAANQWRIWVGPGRLPSTWFDVRDAGDRVVLDGCGFGHGVGLCQYGAQYLATQGMTGEQILRFYYPGIVLARAY